MTDREPPTVEVSSVASKVLITEKDHTDCVAVHRQHLDQLIADLIEIRDVPTHVRECNECGDTVVATLPEPCHVYCEPCYGEKYDMPDPDELETVPAEEVQDDET